MRGQSIPGWAFLKEPSASSGAPSKDKHPTQRSQLTQESPVQSAVSSNAMGPPPSPGPSSKHNLGGGKSGGHYGTRPNRPVSGGPPPPARARRPHSGTDEEEEQPKKKKKRLLVNATPSSSRTAVLPAGASRSATYEKHLLKQPPSSAPAGTSRDAASQNRRATMDTGQLSRMRAQRIVERLNPHPGVKQKQANRSGPTTSRVPSSSLRGPLAGSSKPAIGSRVPSSSLRSQPPLAGPFKPIIGSRGPQQGSRFSSSSRAAPDKSGSATQRPLSTQRRKSAISQYDVIDISDEVDEQAAPRAARQTSRRASAPAAPPDEIIEILDSDEEAQMLSSRSRNTSRDEKPESSQQSTLPRRRAPAPARYKEVDGCIILESSDDDEPPTSSQVPLKKPSSTARRTSPVQRNASEPSSRPMAHTQEQPSDVQIPVPPPEQRPSLVATPPPLDDMEMVDSPPAMFEVPEPSAAVDFEMADGASQAAGSEVRPERGSESQVALAPEDITPATPSSPSHEEQPEAEDLVESNQPLTEPSEAPISMELVTEEGTTPDGTPTLCSTSPSEAGMQPVPELSDPSGSDLAQDPNSLASTPPLPHIAGLRADTASPVSTVLDPGLQNLVISGTPPGSSGSAENVQSPSEGSTATQSSSRRSSSRTRSLRPSDRVPWKMRGAVHDGSTGWIRGALKKRSELQYRLQGTGKSSPLVSPGGDTSAGSPTFSTNALADTSLSELPKDTCVSTAAVHETQKGPVEDVQLSAVVSTSRLDEASGLHQVIDPEVVEGEAAIPEPQSSLPQPTPVVPSVEPTPSVATAEIEKLEIHRPGTQPSTPPLENSLPQPLGPTLSQVIRDAANQNARKNVIDLTFDKSDDDRAAEAAGNPAEKSSESRGEVPPFTRPRDVQVTPATAVQVAVTALSTTSPSTVDRLSPIKPTNAPQLQQPSPSKTTTPSQPEQPSSLKLSFPPLPRNVRRPSAPDALRSPPAESAAIDSNSQASAQETALPAAIPKPRLPRRDVIRNMQTASSSSIGSSAPSLVSFASTATHAATDVPEIEMVVVEAAPSVPARNRLLASDIRPHTAISPSGSGSPSTDTTGEEGRSLLYPSSTPEASPEAEIPDADEDEFPVRPLMSRRNHSEASSEAPSSRPRRSTRLSSSSASSSVEPEELPRRRLWRREPVGIRTPSDDEVARQGGISRATRPKFSRAFEDAGFESLSWKKDRRRVAREFAPVTQSADDIPTDLQDRINALSPEARRASNLQAIFEAEIAANTAEDEPNAPPIRIINDVDDEPTPPMEFYYTNLMWHGADVPRPDFEALKGCGCIGPCNPNSKTCACVRRNKQYWDGGGFMYDQKGKLKHHQYPIFECNINCGCSDDCPNRVMQRGRQYEIAIQKTEAKGWGVFAGPKRIPAYSFLGVYAGEYLTDQEGEKRGLYYNSFGRTYLFDVDFYHVKKDEDEPPKYCIDAYHAGNFTRYLNHSCDPNCAIVAGYINESNIDKPLLTIFTIKDVEPYEELCFSYFGVDEEDKPAELAAQANGAVYVPCRCGTAKCKGFLWK